MRKLEIVVLVLALLILLFGAAVFFYPTIRTALMHLEEQAGIENFMQYCDGAERDATENASAGTSKEPPEVFPTEHESPPWSVILKNSRKPLRMQD